MTHRRLLYRVLLPFFLITLFIYPFTSFSSVVKADQDGPQLLRDFTRNSDRPPYFSGTFFQGMFYFGAKDTDLGSGLWRTNGTPEGTELVYNGTYPSTLSPVNSVSEQSSSPAINNDVLYFGARDDTHGEEFWRTDGTTQGTYMVKEIIPGPDSLDIEEAVSADGYIWFTSANPYQLWRSDGTESGTTKVIDAYIDNIAVINGRGIFRNGSALMRTRSDGSVGPFATIDTQAPWGLNKYVSANGWLYFCNAPYDSQSPLMVTDGETVSSVTQSGTETLIDTIDGFAILGNALYFSGRINGSLYGLWQLPIGSSEATLVKDFTSLGTGIRHLAASNGNIFFHAVSSPDGGTLWKSDGTTEGTRQICSTCNFTIGDFSIAFQKWLYFVASDPVHGLELWVTDGTDTGTSLYRDINPGSGSSYPAGMFADGKMLIFNADDGQHGFEPWGLFRTFNHAVYLPATQR